MKSGMKSGVFPECQVCGHPNLRPAAHAGWCERVTARLLAGIVCEHCGREFDRNATLSQHAPHCPDPASSVASRGSAAAVDATGNGAPGPRAVRVEADQRPELAEPAPASTHEEEAPALTDASMTTAD